MIPDDLAARLRAGDQQAWEVFGDWLLERDDWRAPLVAMERRRAVDDSYDQDAYERDLERFWAEHVEWLRITEDAEVRPPRVPLDYDIHEHGATFGDPKINIPIGRDATATLVVGRWGWARSMVLFLGGVPGTRGRPAGASSPPLPPLLGGDPAVDHRLAALIGSDPGALITSLQITGYSELPSPLAPVSEALRAHPLAGESIARLGVAGRLILAGMPELLAAVPRLEQLRVGSPGPIGPLDLPALRRLSLQNLTPKTLHTLGVSELPALRHLELWFWEYEGDLAGFEAITAGQTLPRIDSLALLISDTDGSDRVLSRLVPSPLLDRLRALDLGTSSISRAGADLLVTNTGALRRIDDLQLSKVTGPGAERVRRIAGP